MGSSDKKDNGDAVCGGGGGNTKDEMDAGGPSVLSSTTPSGLHQKSSLLREPREILQSIEESAKVDMSSLIEIRIARTGRVHDRPSTGKGAGKKMCSAFVIFKDYEAARLMGDRWHCRRT